MTEAGEAMRSLGRPVAHAVNNAVMVLQVNLEALARDLPPDTPGGKRLARATLGAEQLRGLVNGLLALARAPERRQEDGAKALGELRPLLELAAGRPGAVVIETPRGLPILHLERPALDLALVALARQAGAALPRGTSMTLRLSAAENGGAWLSGDFQPDETVFAALAALGDTRRPDGGFSVLLPSP